MESILGVAILLGLAAWFYKTGKRDGSRAGYHAGRRRRR